MSKLSSPIGLRAASYSLPAALAAVVGTVAADGADGASGAIALGSLTSVRLACQYTRHVASTTGAPVFAVDVSMDAASTVPSAVARWVPIFLLDGASFVAGAVDGYPEAFAAKPTATGTTSRGTPPFDVRGARWLRVRMTDVDTINLGAVAQLTMGGET